MATDNQLTETPDVRVQEVHRSFDGVTDTLDGVDLTIRPGEFVALLGRSGSGKSTLLRALAGLDREVSGSGVIDIPDRVSVVFQDSRLVPWLRIADNVAFGLPSGRATDEKVRAALDEVGLDGRERAWPVELSGGEQQRAALARALVREPQLLLADEPFGALDALTKIRMHGLLKDLVARHRPSVLMITHDVDEAIALADRVAVLKDGRLSLEVSTGNGGGDGGAGVDRAEHADHAEYADHADLRARLLGELGVEPVA
ncbi:MAG: ABC transporter ATP-binding protein [Mycobacteriaceae bacterium]|uniref:ABC transporter ATP-binding protein n=1 Tax=Corynebacterium sp. TaxID=1720 RepID=UPI003F9938A9